MLSRKQLIPLKTELIKLRRNGRMYDSQSFGLLVSFSPTPLEARAAFVVSKKISLKSVERHEVKRKLVQAYENVGQKLSKNSQVVFLAKKPSVDASVEKLTGEFDDLITRARI